MSGRKQGDATRPHESAPSGYIRFETMSGAVEQMAYWLRGQVVVTLNDFRHSEKKKGG